MGIANTTASAALVSALTGLDPAAVTGRGTGIDDAGLAHKVAVVRQALAVNHAGPAEPLGCWRPSAASSTPGSPASCSAPPSGARPSCSTA